MSITPATSQTEYGSDNSRRLHIALKVGAWVAVISIVAIGLIGFLLHQGALQQPYLRMAGILEARLARYHPLLKWVNGDTISEEVSTIAEEKKPLTKELSLAMEIDLPLRPVTRGVLHLWIREYPDVETAAEDFAWLEKSGVRRSAPQSPPLMALPETHGFDKLSIDTNAVVGLLGRRHFEITMGVGGFAQLDLLVSGPPGSSDHFIHTGLAAMMIDVWRQAQGLPHTGLGLPFPPDRSGIKEEG